MEEGARDVEGTLFRATQPCRVAGLRLSARAVALMQEKPQEVRVATDENGVLTALLVGEERIPLLTSLETEPSNAVVCRVDGEDLTVVGNVYQKATAQDSRAAGAAAAAATRAEAAKPKKELKKVSIEHMPPPRPDAQDTGVRRKRKAADSPGLLPTPSTRLPSGGAGGGLSAEERKKRNAKVRTLTFSHDEPWLECSVQGISISGDQIRELMGNRVVIPGNGIWWLPTAEAIDLKDSCLVYVRVQNMAEVSRCVELADEIVGSAAITISHASPEAVTTLAHFGLMLRNDMTVQRAITLLTDVIPEHSTSRCLKVWTKVLPRWRTQGKTLRTEKMFRMFHNGYFREIDHVTLTLSVLGPAANRPKVSQEDLTWAITALNTLRNGLRHIMITIRSRTLEGTANLRNVWASDEERKKHALQAGS